MTYPSNSSRAKKARFNWYVLLACALMLVIGGTLAGFAAIVLAGVQGVTPFAYTVAILLCIGLYVGAGVALCKMEGC